MAEGVNAFVWRLDAHAVWQHGDRREEVSTGNERLDARRKRVAVTLELLVFKVQRLMAHRGGLPHVSGLLPAAAYVRGAVVDCALEGVIFPFSARDRDTELHLIDGVSAEILQALLARFFRLNAIDVQGGIISHRQWRRLIRSWAAWQHGLKLSARIWRLP